MQKRHEFIKYMMMMMFTKYNICFAFAFAFACGHLYWAPKVLSSIYISALGSEPPGCDGYLLTGTSYHAVVQAVPSL